MAEVVLDRAISEAEWDALEDPVGGRYEVLDGRLVVTPSGDADHSRVGEDLADLLRRALQLARMDLPVTTDVEWRTVAMNVVAEAPRGDVVVGTRLDPAWKVHADVPLLVTEIWSVRTRPSEIRARRLYWASHGVVHYWEIRLGEEPTDAEAVVYDLVVSADQGVVVRADERYEVVDPLPVTIAPAEIHGWVVRESERADAAQASADVARASAEAAKATADAALERAKVAEAEVERLQDLVEELRAEGRNRED